MIASLAEELHLVDWTGQEYMFGCCVCSAALEVTLPFTFKIRDGHHNDGCLFLLRPNVIPASPRSSVHQAQTPSLSPQRPDSLGSDYGTIDEFCDLCIGYGAMLMPVLEPVIEMRNTGSTTQDTLAFPVFNLSGMPVNKNKHSSILDMERRSLNKARVGQ